MNIYTRGSSHDGDRPPALLGAGELEDYRSRRGADGAPRHCNTAFSYFAIPPFCSRPETRRGGRGEGAEKRRVELAGEEKMGETNSA